MVSLLYLLTPYTDKLWKCSRGHFLWTGSAGARPWKNTNYVPILPISQRDPFLPRSKRHIEFGGLWREILCFKERDVFHYTSWHAEKIKLETFHAALLWLCKITYFSQFPCFSPEISSLALIYLRIYLILCIQLDLPLFEFNDKIVTNLSEIWRCSCVLEEPTCIQMLLTSQSRKRNYMQLLVTDVLVFNIP